MNRHSVFPLITRSLLLATRQVRTTRMEIKPLLVTRPGSPIPMEVTTVLSGKVRERIMSVVHSIILWARLPGRITQLAFTIILKVVYRESLTQPEAKIISVVINQGGLTPLATIITSPET